jgi:hypothetical protein
MTTRQEFDDVMDDLLIAYPQHGREIDAHKWNRTCAIYYDVLHDIPLDLLQSAARECVATLKWFPKAAEIREQALQLVMIALGIPTANDAWAEVTRRMQNSFRVRQVDGKVAVAITGMYEQAPAGHLVRRSPNAEDWSTPIIQKAIDGIGGWAALQRSDNPIADRSQFIRAYERYSMRQMQVARMLPATKQAILRWKNSGGVLPITLGAGHKEQEALP